MLSYTDLKKGIIFLMNDEPYEVLESSFLRMQQRKAVVQTKIRNIISGKILERNFQPSDNFPEAELEKRDLKYLYTHRGTSVLADPQNPKERFSLPEEKLGSKLKWLTPNTSVTALFLEKNIISLQIPIKMDLKVKEAPPGIKGDTAQGGTKTIILETGAVIQAPLFINEGDLVRVNTETGEYVERVSKG